MRHREALLKLELHEKTRYAMIGRRGTLNSNSIFDRVCFCGTGACQGKGMVHDDEKGHDSYL